MAEAPPLCFNAFNHSPWLGAAVGAREQIEAAASAGFPLIGLDSFSLDAALATGASIADVGRWLAVAGIGCGTITAAGMLGSDPGATASIARAGERARALGAPFVQVNVGVAGNDQRAALAAACDAAGGGVRIAIEYMPFTPLCRVADAVALAATIGFDRAGVLIDAWHHERGPDGWDALSAVPAGAIAYVEFDDALPASDDPAHDTVQRRTFPGEGEFDLPRFAAAIEATGYRGMVSVEVLSAEWRGADIAAFAARAFASSRPYWAGSACA